MEYTADYHLNWNPLMINHDPAYIYTFDKNNSKHIQLKRKMLITGSPSNIQLMEQNLQKLSAL